MSGKSDAGQFTFPDDALELSDDEVSTWMVRYICEVPTLEAVWSNVVRAAPLTHSEVRVSGVFDALGNVRVSGGGFLGAVLLRASSDGGTTAIHTSSTTDDVEQLVFPDYSHDNPLRMDGKDDMVMQLWFIKEQKDRRVTFEVWKF